MLLLAAALIVLDPGHTNAAPGALGADGSNEHARNEQMVSRLSEVLTAHDVKWIRSYARDDEPSLKDRTRVANAAHASLFVSIHHDAVHAEDQIPWLDAHPFRPTSWKGRGFSVHVRGDSEASVAAARLIADALIEAGFTPSDYHAQDFTPVDLARGIYDRRQLAVLNGAKVPAVLVECGFLTNPEEVFALTDPGVQQRFVTAIARAIDRIPVAER